MKRRLLTSIVLSVALLAVLSPLVSMMPMGSVASADVVGDAIAFCATAEGSTNNTAFKDCKLGYEQEKRVEAGVANDTLDHYCKTTPGMVYNFCATGWNGAKNGTQPGSTDSALAGEVAQACSNYTGDDFKSCSDGFTGAKQNPPKSEADSCKNAKNQDVCKNAWANANNRLDPSTVSQPAKDNCKSHQSNKDDYNACLIGFTSGASGDKTNDACGLFSGNEKTICQKSFSDGQSSLNGGNSDTPLGCDGSSSALAWIVCPIVNDIFVPLIGQLDKLITNQLFINTGDIFCGDSTTCNDYHAAWASFRNIALGLMVIAGLIAVIAQALGMEILDAYTIRKILPRVLIVAIGITLSWPLMSFFVTLTNDLGIGIRHLIEAPFSNFSDKVGLDFGSNTLLSGLFNTAAVAGAGVLWIATGGFAILFSYAATAALAVLVAVLVLILRQIAITMLILIAPIAIVAYILPNTQKYYKFWWESFSKALLMFPFIIAIIATGRIFSAIALKNGGTDIVSGSIGIIAYFAPYFLIPFTFKFAGGVLSNLGGVVNDRGKGAFGALAQQRGNKRKERVTAARGRGLYRADKDTKGIRKLGHYMNKLGHYTLDADEQFPYDLGSGTGLGRIGGGKYNPLGAVNRTLFGRMAAEQAGEKALQFGEHTAKGVEKANMHYSTAWAALGLRHRLVDGLTEEGVTAMDDKYGIDEDGNRTSKSGKTAVRWQPPANSDFAGLLDYGSELRQYGTAGSMAQYAGEQLREGRVGILSSFGKHADTQRASLTSVALSSAAKDGKLDGDEMRPFLQDMMASPDPAAQAFGQVQLGQIERATQGARQDLRPGKGMRYDENGQLYYVHGNSVINEKQRDGTIKPVPAYKTKLAYDSSSSMKGQAAMSAKAESISEQAPTIISMINAERPELFEGKTPQEREAAAKAQAKIMRRTVIQGSVNSYTDPDSQKAWQDIMAELPPMTPQEEAEAIAENERLNRELTGGAGPQQPPENPFAGASFPNASLE